MGSLGRGDDPDEERRAADHSCCALGALLCLQGETTCPKQQKRMQPLPISTVLSTAADGGMRQSSALEGEALCRSMMRWLMLRKVTYRKS